MTESANRVSDPQPGPSDCLKDGTARQAACESLTHEARNRLCRLAFRFLWNVSDAEDAVQEALHAAHTRQDQLKDERKWWNWLCSIVVQKCHALGRSRQRHTALLHGVQREPEIAAPEPVDLSAEARALRRVLPELPTRQREVVVLRHLEGMGYDEIAEVLDIAPSTARVHARAAREALRDLLKARQPEWFSGQADA